MAINRKKWKQIVDVAESLGAGKWAIYKWSQRGNVPASWQVRIIQHTNGAFTFDDFSFEEVMENADRNKPLIQSNQEEQSC